ncbi:hypothetical protein BGZ54_005626, partial [Gamsiella multidivaricata]
LSQDIDPYGTQSLLLGDDFIDRSPDLAWRISGLYRGITPISLIKEWGNLFTSPPSIARQAIHKFVSFIETQATELIWKPRCNATITWEIEWGITAKMKRASYKGPRGDWSEGNGYIATLTTVRVVRCSPTMQTGTALASCSAQTQRIGRCWIACGGGGG